MIKSFWFQELLTRGCRTGRMRRHGYNATIVYLSKISRTLQQILGTPPFRMEEREKSFSPRNSQVNPYGFESRKNWRPDTAPGRVSVKAPVLVDGVTWSPDGKRVAWGDQNYDLFVTDLASGKSTKVDHGNWEINHYAWSP